MTEIRRFACKCCGNLFLQDVNDPDNVNDKVLMWLCLTNCRSEEINRRLSEGYDPDLKDRYL